VSGVPQPQATQNFGGALLIPLFLLLPIWPLIVFQDPAMQDYANHMARAFIILHADQFRHAYVVHWMPIPDLGWDLWALALGKWLPLHIAATLFFVFYFAPATWRHASPPVSTARADDTSDWAAEGNNAKGYYWGEGFIRTASPLAHARWPWRGIPAASSSSRPLWS